MTKIDDVKCISCLACVSACPYNSIKLKGLFVVLVDDSKCQKCEKKLCKIMCPTGAITLD